MVNYSGTVNARDYRQDSNRPHKGPEKPDIAGNGSTDSGTVADVAGLETLVTVLRNVSAEARNRLVALLIGEQVQGRSDEE